MSNIVKLEELPEGWLRSTDKPRRGIKSKLGSTSASVSLTFFKMRGAARHLILRRLTLLSLLSASLTYTTINMPLSL